MMEMIAEKSSTGGGLKPTDATKTGTIISDTVRHYYIKVHWDGNKVAGSRDWYTPMDLILYEEEENVE